MEKDLTFRSAVKCGTCDGSGSKSKSKPQTCKVGLFVIVSLLLFFDISQVCRGTGQQISQQGFFAFAQPCRGCGGEGSVVSDPCGTCRGDGIVSEVRFLDSFVACKSNLFQSVALCE